MQSAAAKTDDAPPEEEEEEDVYKLEKELGRRMTIASLIYEQGCDDEVVSAAKKAEGKAKLSELLTENSMASLYATVYTKFGWGVDAALVEKMRVANAAKVVEWDEKLADAEKHHGEQEVYDAVIGKADAVAAFGDEDDATAAYLVALDKAFSSGQRIDIQMKMMHAGLFAGNFEYVDGLLRKLRPLVEKAGDWDRRNRLKVYEATFAMSKRSMKIAADFFLDTTKTFTSYDLMPYVVSARQSRQPVAWRAIVREGAPPPTHRARTRCAYALRALSLALAHDARIHFTTHRTVQVRQVHLLHCGDVRRRARTRRAEREGGRDSGDSCRACRAACRRRVP